MFLLRYALCWMSAFALMRGLFLLYNLTEARQLDAGAVLGAFVHGLRLDMSIAAWLREFELVFSAQRRSAMVFLTI